MTFTIRENGSSKTVDLVDGDYTIAYNMRREYAEAIVGYSAQDTAKGKTNEEQRV